jgi:hypothetical protein
MDELKACLKARSDRSSCSAAAAGDARPATSCSSGSRRRASRSALVPLPGPVRQPQRELLGDVGIGINPKLAERVKDADVLLVIGARSAR